MNIVEPTSRPESNDAYLAPLQSRAKAGDQKDAAARLEELFSQLDAIPNLAARELATESVQAVIALYGEALGRIVKLIDSNDDRLMVAVLKDELLRSLLLAHDLHPQTLDERLLGALDSVRPYLNSHGGNIEVLGISDGVARLRFQGTCKTCPSSAVTLELAIRRAVNEACPDLAGVELEKEELTKARS